MAEKLYAEHSRAASGDSPVVSLGDEDPIDEDTDTMRLSELELDMLVDEAELAITPPVEPTTVLNFHDWLTHEVGAEVDKIVPSLIGDTLLTVSFEDAVPLARIISNHALVRNVESEVLQASWKRRQVPAS